MRLKFSNGEMCFFILILMLLRDVSPQIQWRCSALMDNTYYFPDYMRENIFVSTRNLTDSELNFRYVYSIPDDLACSGILTAVEFCYRVSGISINQSPVGGYLTLYLTVFHQNGSLFELRSTEAVYTTPKHEMCNGKGQDMYCCDTVNLKYQAVLPAENFAIGITTPQPTSATILQEFYSMNEVMVYRQNISLGGMTYNFSDASIGQFQALRFHFTASPSTSVTTDPPTTPAITGPPTTPPANSPTIPPADSTNTPVITDPPTTPPADSPTTPATDPPTTPAITDPPTTPPADSPTTLPADLLTTPIVDSFSSDPLTTLPGLPGDPPTTLSVDSPATPPGDTLSTPPGDPPTTHSNNPPTTLLPIDNSSYFKNETINDIERVVQPSADNIIELGIIVGGSVGGLVALLLAIVAVLLMVFIFVVYRRQRSIKRKTNSIINNNSVRRVENKSTRNNSPERTTSFILILANKAYSSVRHNRKDSASRQNFAGNVLVTETNEEACTSNTSYNSYEKGYAIPILPSKMPPVPPVRTHTNAAYNRGNGSLSASNILADSTEGENIKFESGSGSYVDYSYIDPELT